MALLLAGENVKTALLLTDCATGTVLTGASLTALTTSEAVSVADEKAVVPPLVEVLAVLPFVPLVWSQARKVMALEIVPLKSAFGLKYSRELASAAKSRELPA